MHNSCTIQLHYNAGKYDVLKQTVTTLCCTRFAQRLAPFGQYSKEKNTDIHMHGEIDNTCSTGQHIASVNFL